MLLNYMISLRPDIYSHRERGLVGWSKEDSILYQAEFAADMDDYEDFEEEQRRKEELDLQQMQEQQRQEQQPQQRQEQQPQQRQEEQPQPASSQSVSNGDSR